jgi:hypothetical protein
MRRELINHQMTNSVAVERMRLIHRLKFQIQLVRRSLWPEKIKMADSREIIPWGKKTYTNVQIKQTPIILLTLLFYTYLPTYLLKLHE